MPKKKSPNVAGGKVRGGQIRQYGDPNGKPRVRPKGKKKLAIMPGEGYEHDIDHPSLPSRTKQGTRVGASKRRVDAEREKTFDIQRRHARAQNERVKARRHRKRLKKKGVKITDSFTKHMVGKK